MKKTNVINLSCSRRLDSPPFAFLLIAAGALLFGVTAAHSQNSVTVRVDPSQNWIGYMNWAPSAYTLANFPADGGTGNSAWGTAALPATFNNSVLTLSPNVNTYDSTSDSYWVNPDGTGANQMDANMYVENSALAGDLITFSGYDWSHTLVSPYTCAAFIKELDPANGYAVVASATADLVNTASPSFSISLQTTAGMGYVIQYGFETMGPNANPATVSSLGSVVVSSNPPPSGPIIISTSVTPPIAIVGSNEVFNVNASAGAHSMTYQWKKNGVNISGANSATYSLTGLPVTAEGNYTVLVTDTTTTLSSTGAVYLSVEQPSHLVVDPYAPYIGYLNFFAINSDGTQGAYEHGQTYSPAGLMAGFVNGAVSLMPNTNQWETTDMNNIVSGVSIQSLEGDFYIQDDNLSGQTLTFSGYCPSNSLSGTCVAQVFIEDFNSSYAITASAITNAVAGQAFSITLPTTAGDHIQYGIRIDGPIESPDGSPDPWGGKASTGALVSIPLPAVAASRAGNVANLTFFSENGHNYTVQYANGLTNTLSNTAWQTLSTIGGNGSNQTVQDVNIGSHSSRFYRIMAK